MSRQQTTGDVCFLPYNFSQQSVAETHVRMSNALNLFRLTRPSTQLGDRLASF